jgi:hypothetical protein
VTSSDPTVLVSDTSAISFSNTDGGTFALIKVRPVSAGTAILSLTSLAGQAAAATGALLVYNVAEPAFSIPGVNAGRDVQVAAQIQLGAGVPTPSSDLSVTIQTSDTFTLQFGSSPTASSVSTLSVIVPAGQRLSVPFYVRGIGTSTANLSITGGSFSSFLAVPVAQTSFIFLEAAQSGSIHATAGVATSLTVVPSLPSAPAPTSPYSIRPGAVVTVNVTSSDSSIVTVTTPQVTLGPGATLGLVGLRPLRSGQATIRISGTGYDFSSTQSAIPVIVQ